MKGFDSVEKKVDIEPTKQEALRAIEVIEQQVFQTGRVDSEPNQFQLIRELLENENITPREAIVRANSIWETRQDYN